MSRPYEQVPRPPQEQRNYADALRVIAEVSIETMADIELKEAEAVETAAKRHDRTVVRMAEQFTDQTAPMPPVKEAEKLTYQVAVEDPKTVIGYAEHLTRTINPERLLAKAEDITHEYGVRIPLQVVKEAERITAAASKREQEGLQDAEHGSQSSSSDSDSDGGLPARTK